MLYLKQVTKHERINSFGYIKIYNSAQQKNSMVKRYATDEEEMFAVHTANKEGVFKIYEELLQIV